MLAPSISSYQYQIQIGQDQSYPFNGVKPSRFNVRVKQTIDFKHLKNAHNKINKIIQMQHQHAIKVLKVVESHVDENYQLYYEYIPYKINHQCQELKDYFPNKHYQQPLLQLFKYLLEKGIKPVIKAQSFGFTKDFHIKKFIGTSFDLVSATDDDEVSNLAISLIYQCQKVFEKQVKTSLNFILKTKLLDISEKMKKINPGQYLKQFIKKPKRQSSSQNSDSFAKTGQHQQVGNAQWHFDNDFQFADSYSQKDMRKNKKKRTRSFKEDQKTYAVPKQKKASWGEQKSSLVESDRTTVLKKRITEALLKTQKTLTKYQKIRSKSGKKKKNVGQS